MARSFQPCVLTANDLLEGDVVYLAHDGGWTRHLAAARLLLDEAEANRSLAEAEVREDAVINPYLANVENGGGNGLRPEHFREDFRARGPSNYPHGKQAGS